MFFDDFVQEALRLFPNDPEAKETQKNCLNYLLLKRKDVLGLLLPGFGKSLIYQLFEIVLTGQTRLISSR